MVNFLWSGIVVLAGLSDEDLLCISDRFHFEISVIAEE